MTQRKHILVMSSWYPSRVDPYTGNFVERFARLLAREHQVTVLFTRSEDRKGIEIVQTSGPFRTIIAYHAVGKNIADKFLKQRKVVRAAFREVEEPVDVIFAHVTWPKGLQFLQAKHRFKAPLLLLEHASYYRSGHRLSAFQQFVIGKCLKQATEVAAVSEVLREDIRRRFGIRDISIIPNPVNEAVFYPKVQEITREFIHISTLDPAVKNVEHLLRAVHLLRQSDLQVKLLVISDQKYDHLQRLCNELQIEDAVSFAGPLGETAVADELRRSEALVVASTYETFGIVTAEAWMCGKPVISTPVGIARNLESFAGVASGSSAGELAAAMKNFLLRKETFVSKDIAEAGKKYASSNVLKLLNEHISKLTGPQGPDR